MSLPMDSRKNRSSSTTETNSFFIMPPLAVRSNPPCGRPNNAVTPYMICAKDATGAMPLLRKLWLISEREFAQAGHQKGSPSCANACKLWSTPRVSSGDEWGCSIQGLGLELHDRAKPANRDKGSFPLSFNPSS